MDVLQTEQGKIIMSKVAEGGARNALKEYIEGIEWDQMCELYLLSDYCDLLDNVDFTGLTPTEIEEKIEEYKEEIRVVIYPNCTAFEAFSEIMDLFCDIELPWWVRDSLDYEETIKNFAMNQSWTAFDPFCGLVLEV